MGGGTAMTLDQLSAAATESFNEAMQLVDVNADPDLILVARCRSASLHDKLAQALVNAYRTGQLVAVTDDAIERVARAILRAKIDRNARGYEHLPETFNVPFAQDYFDANVVIEALAAKGTGGE